MLFPIAIQKQVLETVPRSHKFRDKFIINADLFTTKTALMAETYVMLNAYR